MSAIETQRTSPRLLKLATLIATAGGLGFLPRAPGTFGSIGGLFLASSLRILLVETGFSHVEIMATGLLILVFGTLIAIWSIRQVESHWNSHDDQRIVIDEVLGQAIPILALPISNFGQLFVLFVMFRALDIFKPGPIGWADRLPGPWGTLLDDLIAGGIAALMAWPLLSYL